MGLNKEQPHFLNLNITMKYLLLLLIVYTFYGCYTGTQKVAHTNEIREILIDPDKFETFLDLSEILDDSVEVIPLEMKDECLISQIVRIEFYKDKILVSDKANAKIFVFTSEGKYLKSIGKQGQGPGEYSFLGDFTLKGDSVVVQDRSRNKYIVYDLYSNAFREISYDMLHLEVVSFDEIAYFISNYSHSKYGDYNLFRFNLNTSEVLSLEVPFGEDGIDKSSYGLKRYASKSDSTAMLIYPLNDTVYTLNKETVFPSYVIHYTSRNLPSEVNVSKENIYRYVHENKYLKGWEFMQNSQNYMLGYYIDNGFKYFVYNKQNSNIRVGQWLKIGSLSELFFSDFYTTTDNQLYFIQYAAVLSSNWKLTRAKSTNEHFKNKMDAIVASLNEDANPVLFKCHFKNK